MRGAILGLLLFKDPAGLWDLDDERLSAVLALDDPDHGRDLIRILTGAAAGPPRG